MNKRLFTATRLLSHWTLGATIGSVITTNNWNEWAIRFLILYILLQLVGWKIEINT